MANFATLLQTIASNIYTNGRNEIDAADLKSVLNAMVEELGQAGYVFKGVAQPSTNPGTPDTNVFYLAGVGTFTNFGGTTVDKGHIGVFAYNGSWSYQVLTTGAWFDSEVYPGEAALEMTFYDSDESDGVTIKINADVSNLGNSKLEAISAWWAAQKERRINEIGGFTIEKDSVVDSSPSTLGLFQYIKQGQIIDSITGATSLIFISNETPGQEVTVNAADLPYTAAKTFVSVKSPSGTLTNVKIHVEGEVAGGKLADGVITTDKIADEAVTKDKLGQNVSADLDWAVASNSYYRNSQAGDVAAKVITTYKNMSLIGGGSLKVTFEQANTADDATLNIDNKGAKPLYYNGARVSSTNSWAAGETVEIYYNSYNSGIFYAKKWQTDVVSVSQNTQTLEIGGEEKGALGGIYAESPEWVKVVTDSADKVLYGVKADGKFYFGDGCPPQVQEYVLSQINAIGIDALLATKVDRVVGKSLIDAQYAEGIEYAESPEWVKVVTDNDGKIIEGYRPNGTKKINVPIDNGMCVLSQDEDGEFISASLDNEDKVIEGITQNGEKKVFIPLRNKFLEDKIKKVNDKYEPIAKANYNPKSYYDKGGVLSPLIQNNEGKPLTYKANTYFEKPVCYPDGTIIYATNSGNVIKKKAVDGTETTLLTVEGAVGAFQMIWMDSNYNIYAAPRFNGGTYYQNSGLYKLTFGEDSFAHVLSLEDIYSSDASERATEAYTIWTMTEDREGNLYAGVYGNPMCPFIYKSTDGGDTWFFLKDLRPIVPNGKHIHFIIYNKYDNALYCTVGEVNMLIRSVDGGNTWRSCDVTLERMKSCSACVVSDGIILGSDYGYWGMMYKVYADGSYKTTAKIWANAIFSIRRSDLTGYIYALGVIDHAVTDRAWYPPTEALTDSGVLQNWIDSNPAHLDEWREYNASMQGVYPDDAIIPQHSAILISKDNGESWEILLRLEGSTHGALSSFKNGECSFTMEGVTNSTLVITEGKHKYVEGGIDCTGEILIRLNNTNLVEQF